ncbi:NAD-dependent malic enzyme 1, mitochondrial-like [Dendrobium catenatum]|uniref:NAD-dependent malic enzyme 1, mitochondrial-like n=1 Tax=Dendrobium catenatum TaxID=906689 RepID=UPI0009F3BAB5|nr:NAD-dependent malic enzyme 1, mitochondrial-like [Dendrobium catenatum]
MAFFSFLLARRMCWPAASRGWRAFTTSEGSRPVIVHKRSLDILHDPWFNKGTAFPITERDRLDLRGLLPPNVMTPQQQIDRFSKFRSAFALEFLSLSIGILWRFIDSLKCPCLFHTASNFQFVKD